MTNNYVAKIKENGIMRSAVVLLDFFTLPKIRSFLYKHLYKFTYYGKNIQTFSGVEMDNPHLSIGDNVVIGKNVRFGGVGKIVIGKNTGIGGYGHIESINEVIIGKNCQIARFCYFIDHDHYFKNPKLSLIKQTNFENDFSTSRPISIGGNCWIGANVTILKGVSLGDNCIVGAGSVVTKSFPAGSMIAGVPARKVGQR